MLTLYDNKDNQRNVVDLKKSSMVDNDNGVEYVYGTYTFGGSDEQLHQLIDSFKSDKNIIIDILVKGNTIQHIRGYKIVASGIASFLLQNYNGVVEIHWKKSDTWQLKRIA